MPTDTIVLIGDSIFDNAAYVPGEPCVTDQLRDRVGAGMKVSLLANDGDMVKDVAAQLERLPQDASHLIVSIGGNDALSYEREFMGLHGSAADILGEWTRIQKRFRSEYRRMLHQVTKLRRNTAICTIYDAVPSIDEIEMTALSLFNDVIIDEGIRMALPIIDMRRVCPEASDYSRLSPIEPSSQGGAKIAQALHDLLGTHDFSSSQTVIYP